MDLPFTAPGQIIPEFQKDLPEFRQLANPNRGSCHSRQPDNSSGRTRLPANPQNQPMTTNCESFNSGIQTQNAHQNPPIQKLNQSEDGPKPRKSSTVCGLPETETCERQTCQTEPVPAATCEPPIRSVVTKAKPCVENDVIPKETTKRDIESNQTNPYNPELGAESAAIEPSDMEDAGEASVTSRSERDVRCKSKVKYNGREGFLPLFIRRDDYKSIVGTNWFGTMQFDFNSIFGNINLIPRRTSPIIHDLKPQIAN
ncbi:hypothetical protein DAPPUDRAFT_110406 [Daphnia pulex]|uniref:Uncharacterized protein n=1 Tax=Daphnia pulex TaxID=6669 RepID=E9H678_DAPPU|nr:hypothetical protein DAPPUDRAFT_110406 [Daphnia pulex]|eukprot:EFX72764.1 hypothetical protein DAPPUDRAFT_110406 [Daphnia pulex]